MTFKIIEGVDYYDKYEEFIEAYNNEEILVRDIKNVLGITSAKFQNYYQKAKAENRLIKRSGGRKQGSLKHIKYLEKLRESQL